MTLSHEFPCPATASDTRGPSMANERIVPGVRTVRPTFASPSRTAPIGTNFSVEIPARARRGYMLSL